MSEYLEHQLNHCSEMGFSVPANIKSECTAIIEAYVAFLQAVGRASEHTAIVNMPSMGKLGDVAALKAVFSAHVARDKSW